MRVICLDQASLPLPARFNFSRGRVSESIDSPCNIHATSVIMPLCQQKASRSLTSLSPQPSHRASLQFPAHLLRRQCFAPTKASPTRLCQTTGLLLGSWRPSSADQASPFLRSHGGLGSIQPRFASTCTADALSPLLAGLSDLSRCAVAKSPSSCPHGDNRCAECSRQEFPSSLLLSC